MSDTESFAVPAGMALSPRQGTAPANAPVEPVLDTQDIQGNGLVGFNKDHQAFLFLRFEDPARTKGWLRKLTPTIATAAELLMDRRLFRALRARRRSEPELGSTWVNIAFSWEGVRKLTSTDQAERFTSEAFRLGMAPRAAKLGDPVDAAGRPIGWLVGQGDSSADALVIVASDRPGLLAEALADLRRGIEETGGIRVVFLQGGATLPGALRGHEHFGFRDGVSHPGVRGRVSEGPNDYLTPRLIAPDDPIAATHARPGQPLIWPGHFILGEKYPLQDSSNAINPRPNQAPTPAWATNGSFVVFRRLRQDVAAFSRFLAQTARELAQKPDFPGMTAERLGALLVGRWPSGAPVMRTPGAEDRRLGGNAIAANQFNFAADTPLARLTSDEPPGDPFPAPTGDRGGLRCPFASHIRKVNPRDDITELGGPNKTLLRRILRRGIPYGPPAGVPPVDDGVDRGLLFVSYQADIATQFEFLCTDWANSTLNPRCYDGDRPAGLDPVIGQSTDAAGSRQRSFTLPALDHAGSAWGDVQSPRDWVIPTGGGYFFSPSISALRDVLSA